MPNVMRRLSKKNEINEKVTTEMQHMTYDNLYIPMYIEIYMT